MIRRPPRSTLFPTRRSSDLIVTLAPTRPLEGVKLVMVGATTTAKLLPLVAVPAGVVTLRGPVVAPAGTRSEEHTSELQSHSDLVCRLLLEKKKKQPEDKNVR